MSRCGLSDSMVDAVATSLSDPAKCASLTSLMLDGNTGAGDAAAESLSRMLGANSTLTGNTFPSVFRSVASQFQIWLNAFQASFLSHPTAQS
mmetsp:Transcript_72629/g.194109  ORF Transcript_72629/g.194109 Transcript_72629/m.194109 type:complete len:92 (-) Transcript_72629:129-404(-)